MELLKIEELVMRFGGLKALNGVSIGIKEGDIHAIIGPNGAGKTTLLRAIAGLILGIIAVIGLILDAVHLSIHV
jgi:ABC-type branched-subunit amino acid transport system ATPase component